MKISRTVDVYISVEDGRSMRLSEELEFNISGTEAAGAVFAEVEGEPAEGRNLTLLLNNVANFMRHVPDEKIADLSPEARRTVVTFLEGQAKRFYEKAPAPKIGAAVEP